MPGTCTVTMFLPPCNFSTATSLLKGQAKGSVQIDLPTWTSEKRRASVHSTLRTPVSAGQGSGDRELEAGDWDRELAGRELGDRELGGENWNWRQN